MKECPQRARKFLAYIEKHRYRLVNYKLLQAEHYISIGSGAVESAIKQIDRRLKISGGQWNSNSVSPMLRLRCVTRRTDAPANAKALATRRPLGRAGELMVNHLSRIVGDTASRREAICEAVSFRSPLGHIL